MSAGSRRSSGAGSFAVVPPAFFFVLALYLQQGRGFTPLFSGVISVAVGVGFFAAMLTAQQMTAYLGRQILALGALIVAAGGATLALVAGTSSSRSSGVVFYRSLGTGNVVHAFTVSAWTLAGLGRRHGRARPAACRSSDR